MFPFRVPDYSGGSVVNLMSSISNSFKKYHDYCELSSLGSYELNNYKNVVLLVVDGVGFNYLCKQKNSFLYKHLVGSIDSVFLPTTACANTVFSVGYPPQQHGLTGWDIYLKEIGSIVSILPFTPRPSGKSLDNFGFDIFDFIGVSSFHKGFNGKCFTLIDNLITNSSFTKAVSGDSEVVGVNNYRNLFVKLRELVLKKSWKRRFFHAYIWEFDDLAHVEGIKSSKVKKKFDDIDARIRRFVNSVSGSNTKVIVTSDHGFVDSGLKKTFFVEDFKGLGDCLVMPLSGEPRTRYCFLKPGKEKEFEKIVRRDLKNICWCFKSSDLISSNIFGLGEACESFVDRVGDYTLIMKKDFVLNNKFEKRKVKKKKLEKGFHGGVSKDELLVPLVVFDC